MDKIQYGWKCPSCGAVMAPWQNRCVNCSGGSGTPTSIPVSQPEYEPAPWWTNPQYHWDITCNTTATTKNDSNMAAWNNTPSMNSLQNALKSAKITI